MGNIPPRGAADRVAYLLTLLADTNSATSLSQFAELAGLPQSTVHRLLQVLVRAGLVERGAGLTYRPGRELYRLASNLVSRFDLVHAARDHLESLTSHWQETAVLCAYSPVVRKAYIADVVHSPHPLRFAVEKGGEVELPWGSLGRAILAFLPRGDIDVTARQCQTGPLTGRPRDRLAEIDAALAAIRDCGFSRYYEPQFDVAGISAPIFGVEGKILGCIGVTMPSRRYQLHLEDNLAHDVLIAAQTLSEKARISYS